MPQLSEDDRLTRMEYALWGLRGDNGLIVEVRELRKSLNNWRREERERREKEAKEAAAERKRDRRWRLVFAVSVVSAILVAAGLIAQAL